MDDPTARDPIQRLADFRALCAELLASYEDTFVVSEPGDDPLVQRARAFLAQPEPEGPSVMEIIALADEIDEEGLGQVDLVRRALSRWGK